MSRILVQFVLPTLLPALLYALWLAAMRRRVEAAGDDHPGWSDHPWVWLLALGLFFAAIITIASAMFSGDGTEGLYVPPRIENGRIVPGHIDSR
jgi:hypothetical protein